MMLIKLGRKLLLCVRQQLGFIALISFIALLAACASSPNEVVIRDATGAIPSPDKTPASDSEKAPKETSLQSDQQISTATAVIQNKQEQAVSPLQQRLRLSAQQRLAAGDLQEAIVLAEKGLRIDRKDAQFYLVLARAYQQLNDKSQSSYFAQQGLRYAKKESQTYRELTRLAS